MFQSLASVRAVLRDIQRDLAQDPQAWRGTGAWSLAEVLDHAAQSVEYSLDGFPQLKPALFRRTVGRVAFAMFKRKGRMSHPLAAPIPGAPALATDLAKSLHRLQAALDRFEAHPGPWPPHFAYGPLSREDYHRAHLMHLNDHWAEVVRASPELTT